MAATTTWTQQQQQKQEQKHQEQQPKQQGHRQKAELSAGKFNYGNDESREKDTLRQLAGGNTTTSKKTLKIYKKNPSCNRIVLPSSNLNLIDFVGFSFQWKIFAVTM